MSAAGEVCELLLKRRFAFEAAMLSMACSSISQEKRDLLRRMCVESAMKHSRKSWLNLFQSLRLGNIAGYWIRCFVQQELRLYKESIIEMNGESDAMICKRFYDMYKDRMKFKLKEAEHTASADPASRITFQYVESVEFKGSAEAQEKLSKKNKIVNGRMLQRRFICFEKAEDALRFAMCWKKKQDMAIESQNSRQVSMLLEFGSYEKKVLKKWILDVDAPLDQLEKDASIRHLKNWDGLVVEMCQNIVNILYSKLKVLRVPCPFTVITRHTEKKRSWHVTLNALADHDGWRLIMRSLDEFMKLSSQSGNKRQREESELWQCMYSFVDPSTLKNSKSQPMQVLFSTKIAENCKDMYSHFFTWHGTFFSDGRRMEESPQVNDMVKFARCSMMLQDEWSVPVCHSVFQKLSTHQRVISKSQKNREEALLQCIAKQSPREDQMNRELSLEWPCEWMKGILISPESKCTSIPAMYQSKNMPRCVEESILKKRSKILVHTYVVDARLCPRSYVIEKKIKQHSNNSKCVVMCLEEKHPRCGTLQSDFRMFALCMSDKCKKLKNAKHCDKWIELRKEDVFDASFCSA